MAEEPVGGFWRRFGVLFGAGAVGTIALIPMIAPAVRRQLASPPVDPGIPFPAALALSVVNPLLLLAIGAAVGIRLAPRVGLVSLLDQWAAQGAEVSSRLRTDLPLAVGLGAGGGAAIIILDLLFQPYLPSALREAGAAEAGILVNLLGGMLYGGITEELIVRWGMMTFLAWAAWRVAGRGRPGASVMWGAVLGSAVAFGLGHLPAVAAAVPLTSMVVIRTVLLNAFGGIIFGWLFWRHTLEAAMVAHASSHVVFAAAAIISG